MTTLLETLREYRIVGMAIFDWATSLLGGWIIGYFIFKVRTLCNWVLWFIFWILLGILVHIIFKVDTMLGYYLGLNKKPDRL